MHNVDCYGYNTLLLKRGGFNKAASWGELLGCANAGQVAIVNEPVTGLLELFGLALQPKQAAKLTETLSC